jgi:hypothetical protein
MRSHFVRGKPTATPEYVKRLFEEQLPSGVHAYLRVLRLSELPTEANIGRRYYAVFDADGSMLDYDPSKRTLLRKVSDYGIRVHPVQ